MTRKNRVIALFSALLIALGMVAATGAGPAAATHTTCKSDNYTPPGTTGYIQYSMCWLTNSAHTGVKPYYWTATNYTNTTVEFRTQTYVDYPGGNLVSSNERGLDSEILSPTYVLSYGQGSGQNANVPMGSPPYALIDNYPTWRINYRLANGNSYPLVSRLGV